jgi:putative endonuclease
MASAVTPFKPATLQRTPEPSAKRAPAFFHLRKICHPERSEGPALALAFVFLSVIPAGNLLAFALALLLSFPQGICFFPPRRNAILPSMKRDYNFWVYILSSRSRNLYIGMTNNLPARTSTHREGVPGSHTARYSIHRLVYFEYFRYVRSAIAREKELKKWTREQKIALIEKQNPTWDDLYPTLFEKREAPQWDGVLKLEPEAVQQQIPSGNDSKKNKSKD